MTSSATVSLATTPSRKKGGSIISTVRTKRSRPPKGETIEIRVDDELKNVAQAKAKREQTTLSAILASALADYVGGGVQSRHRKGPLKEARGAVLADFRRLQGLSHNLLFDLRHLAQAYPDSPLAEPAIKAILAELLATSGATFQALGGKHRVS